MAEHYLKLSKILSKLLYEKRMNPSDLARAVNLPTPTVHRLVTGKSTRPYRSSLEPIAEYFSLSIDQLIGETPLPSNENSLISIEQSPRKLPIISWEEAIDRNESQTNENAESEYLVASNSLNARCFVVKMNDHSMAPIFTQNSYLIIDPDKKPWDRSYVLVKLHQHDTPIFRQILIDGEDCYLKPLNPDLTQFKMKYLTPEDKILGVLIETRINFMPE